MMIDVILNNKLLLAMSILPLSIIANNLLGAALAGLEHKYSLGIFLKGIKKGALVYSGIIIYAFISLLMSNLTVMIGSGSYSLVDAMYIIILAAITSYVAEGVDKLMEITKYKIVEEGDIDE